MVPVSLLLGLCMYYIGTWTHWVFRRSQSETMTLGPGNRWPRNHRGRREMGAEEWIPAAATTKPPHPIQSTPKSWNMSPTVVFQLAGFYCTSYELMSNVYRRPRGHASHIRTLVDPQYSP